jgi:hypothetical protein
MSLFEKLLHIDRRIIFLTVLLAASVPLIFPFTQALRINPESERFYHTLDKLEKGDVIILSMDYSPETRPEIDPMSEGVLRHCFHKGIRVIGMVTVIPNIPIGEDLMRRVAAQVGAVYGRDYIYLGFKPETRAVIINISEEIRKAFPVDFYRTPLDDLPMMNQVHNFDDIALVVANTADDVSKEWLLTANTRFGVRVIMGIISNYYPSFTPYIESKQILGALAGMKGAAEYEQMLMDKGVLDHFGDASKGMATQSAVHILIIFYIIVGNIGYLVQRSKRLE